MTGHDSAVSPRPCPLDDIASPTTGELNRSRKRLAFTPLPEELSSSSSSSDDESSDNSSKAPAKESSEVLEKSPGKFSENQNRDSPSKKLKVPATSPGKYSQKETNDSPSKKTKVSAASPAKLSKKQNRDSPSKKVKVPGQESPQKTKTNTTMLVTRNPIPNLVHVSGQFGFTSAVGDFKDWFSCSELCWCRQLVSQKFLGLVESEDLLFWAMHCTHCAWTKCQICQLLEAHKLYPKFCKWPVIKLLKDCMFVLRIRLGEHLKVEEPQFLFGKGFQVHLEFPQRLVPHIFALATSKKVECFACPWARPQSRIRSQHYLGIHVSGDRQP